MRTYLSAILVLFSWMGAVAQSSPAPRIKVLLLGSIHFTPSNQDLYQNKVVDVADKKRQAELGDMLKKLGTFAPNQICVEVVTKGQSRIDSEYHQFLKGQFKPGTDEVDQIAYPLAKQLGLSGVTCVNYRGSFDFTGVSDYAKANNQTSILTDVDQFSNGITANIAQVQQTRSLSDVYTLINSREELNKNLAIYTEYLVRVGQGSNYAGTDLVANWYSTNLHIYTNILRAIRPTDKAIMVLFGYGHVPILKHLFESNPRFEVVEVAQLLKK